MKDLKTNREGDIAISAPLSEEFSLKQWIITDVLEEDMRVEMTKVFPLESVSDIFGLFIYLWLYCCHFPCFKVRVSLFNKKMSKSLK